MKISNSILSNLFEKNVYGCLYLDRERWMHCVELCAFQPFRDRRYNASVLRYHFADISSVT